jgi:FixJ family two-component response regulator
VEVIARVSMHASDNLIVLVEPDHAVREAIAALIRQHGWKITAYAEAGDLKSRLNESVPIALICESSLPDMAAKKVLKICRSLDVPVIFLGHKREIQDAVDLMHLGAADFLEKPFPQDRLLRLLDGLTAKSHS